EMPTKPATKSRGGRPPLPPGQRKDKPLFVLMKPALHKALADIARKNSRSLSEEVTRRLSVSLQWPSWEDLEGPAVSDQKLAALKRELIEEGRKHWGAGPVGAEALEAAVKGATGPMFDRIEEVERRLALITDRPGQGRSDEPASSEDPPSLL